MNKQIKLTESELHYIVNEAVNTILQEQMDEGTWNNFKTGVKTFFGARQISPQTTVAQLVGGKYNNNKLGTMTGMVANRHGQLKRRGYTG